MNPDQLSEKGTESGHQKALFAWAAMAQRWGFELAFDMEAYSAAGFKTARARIGDRFTPVGALAWLHAIANGGLRDARTASLMKAEGVRKGIADVFLPVGGGRQHGLYIEMKKPKGGVQSEDQILFESHCIAYRYKYVLCKSWLDAAMTITNYLTEDKT